MRKDSRLFDGGRPFRVAHQILCITGFNFERKSIIGYIELLIHPLRTDLRKVKINSKQCCIYRIAVNDTWDAKFDYNDPTLKICQGDARQHNLDYFERNHFQAMMAVDSDLGNGEVTVHLPKDIISTVSEMKPFRLCVEFSIEEPQGGIQFVVPDMDGSLLERGAHLFTYGHENSSRLWFPCIDSYSEVCTWKIELTVEMYMTAISCGDLIETVYTPDLRKKTYHYYLSTPTAAPNIALAVGPFEVLVDPHMHEVTHFCLPHLTPLLRNSTEFLHEVFEFYEDLISSRYPYSCYKQVFVDQAYEEASSYATLSILSTNLLHTKRIIDQVPKSRQIMAHAIAQQFFGCFISMSSWCDAWLTKGISTYLSNLYRRKSFGNNEYRYHIKQELQSVVEYEQTVAGIILDPSFSPSAAYFNLTSAHTLSPVYTKVYQKKAHLVIRMLELQIGRELLLQAFNKLLALATSAVQQKFISNTWCNMLLSQSSFLKGLSTVTGKDVKPFLEQWVNHSGCAMFKCSFSFNRKRNVVELDIQQDMNAKGAIRYVGPLTVAIQELDGTFSHTFKIEENKTKFEITCHSRSRRNKKKKIPLCTGDEVDMDLNAMDTDSPMLWLRVDPEMTTIRHVSVEQPDFMWQYMMTYERDVISQYEAIEALRSFATPVTRKYLTDIIENNECFYRIRMQAAFCLSKIANDMVRTWMGPPAMLALFKKMFGSPSCPEIIRRNNFSNFQDYFLLKTIPVAVAKLRNVQNICPPEVIQFLLALFKYNDNAKNKYEDNYYRAALIEALGNTVTPAVTTVTVTGMGPSTDSLTKDTKLLLEEITRFLNLEKLLPSYKLTVTVSCLKAIRTLQQYGHLPSDPSVFKSYAVAGNFIDVRIAAIQALVDYIKVESSQDILSWILEMVKKDPDPYIRHCIVTLMIQNPPFKRDSNSLLATTTLVEELWTMMNCTFSHDARLRCGIADLYYALFGRKRPSCLPLPESVMVLNLKSGTTTVSSGVTENKEDSMLYQSGIGTSSISRGGSSASLSGVAAAAAGSNTGCEMEVDIEEVAHPPSGGASLVAGANWNTLVMTPAPPTPSTSQQGFFRSSSSLDLQPVTDTVPDQLLSAGSPDMDERSHHSYTSITAGTTVVAGGAPPPNAASIGGSAVFTTSLQHSQPYPSDSMSRLSESNSDDDDQPTLGPTSFDSSMFPRSQSNLDTYLHSSVTSETVEILTRETTTAAQDTSQSSSKLHKSKKKKKNKKNKKHKHKHDKDKGDRVHIDDSGSFSLVNPTVSTLMLDPSSDSNLTSPAGHDRPSSPEFEVI